MSVALRPLLKCVSFYKIIMLELLGRNGRLLKSRCLLKNQKNNRGGLFDGKDREWMDNNGVKESVGPSEEHAS